MVNFMCKTPSKVLGANLVHQHFSPSIHTSRDCIVQDILKTLLLSYHSVQKVRLVDVWGLIGRDFPYSVMSLNIY